MSDDTNQADPNASASASIANAASVSTNASSGAPIASTDTQADGSAKKNDDATAQATAAAQPTESTVIPVPATPEHDHLKSRLQMFLEDTAEGVERDAEEILAWLKKHV